MSLYIGIDLGTSGCRAVVIDDDGRLCTDSQTVLPRPTRRGTCVEQAPGLWWESVLATLEAVIPSVPTQDVRAIAVDGTSATLLVTDSDGQPLAPALMYNDGRSRQEARQVAALAPATSGAHGVTSSLAKLLWLQARYPEARHALHQADWISARLGAPLGRCDENNALKLGFDPVHRCWPQWLEALGVREDMLPAPAPPGTLIGQIAPAIAKRFGLGTDTGVVAGTTDSVAAFIATGVDRPGDAVTSLGSTLVLKVLSERPVFAPAYGVYSHRLGERWLAGGASNSGGAVLLKFFTDTQIAAMTPSLQPERPTGLDYYPLPDPGERFPVNDPDLAPRLAPRPAQDIRFFQGMLEGMAAIERQGYRLLAALGAPYPTSVRSVGGGAKNRAWTRIRERLLSVPMLTPHHQDAAYGAALLARQGVVGRSR